MHDAALRKAGQGTLLRDQGVGVLTENAEAAD
jgi:hypothetical protein